MNSPKVYDRNEREIVVGAAVELDREGALPKQKVVRVNPPVGGVIAITLSAALPAWAEERIDGSFTCPDLEVVEPQERKDAVNG